MSRMEDDDPPIKTHPASKAYLANWEATFGEPDPTPAQEAVRAYLAEGGEPSPIGWYGVITIDPEIVAERDRFLTEARAAERPWERQAMSRPVFDVSLVRRDNTSPIVSEHTVLEDLSGIEMWWTWHEDGSITVTRETQHAPECERLATEGAACNCNA